ncbi:hypothetical protein [Psychromicrobium lacuslunae]|uniref:Uncharacterized protein n=1 Tax=Psychromicrobium lacuslunae TaxID=1618207 RepID=A0A0D4BX55_9MICC|nr:hypothetical protein [Psychromicrobium lacuslunae]AJT40908.1 hypothetical protein UM93_04170 [Psychromicrobium lacuslunae]
MVFPIDLELGLPWIRGSLVGGLRLAKEVASCLENFSYLNILGRMPEKFQDNKIDFGTAHGLGGWLAQVEDLFNSLSQRGNYLLVVEDEFFDRGDWEGDKPNFVGGKSYIYNDVFWWIDINFDVHSAAS